MTKIFNFLTKIARKPCNDGNDGNATSVDKIDLQFSCKLRRFQIETRSSDVFTMFLDVRFLSRALVTSSSSFKVSNIFFSFMRHVKNVPINVDAVKTVTMPLIYNEFKFN